MLALPAGRLPISQKFFGYFLSGFSLRDGIRNPFQKFCIRIKTSHFFRHHLRSDAVRFQSPAFAIRATVRRGQFSQTFVASLDGVFGICFSHNYRRVAFVAQYRPVAVGAYCCRVIALAVGEYYYFFVFWRPPRPLSAKAGGWKRIFAGLFSFLQNILWRL